MTTTGYQRGLDMILKVDTSATITPSFETLGGIRSTKFAINNEAVDVTNADSLNRWKEILANAGSKGIQLSGSGVAKTNAVFHKVHGYSLAGTIRLWQVIIPGLGTHEGLFHMPSLSLDGQHNKEISLSISLNSSGEPVFTVEA
ncbi:MAG: phage major tail protein, TP901-1 family [Hyphomicrobiaceae bacterium]